MVLLPPNCPYCDAPMMRNPERLEARCPDCGTVIAKAYEKRPSSTLTKGAPSKMKELTCWELVEFVVPETRCAYLWSKQPGMGKTHFAYTSFFGKLPVYKTTLTEDTPAYEIRGNQSLVNGSVVWQDGPAMMAFRNGGVMILDELPNATADTFTFCLALMDTKESAVI